ncbi:TonB-dependent receptor plug domain-containing protein [Bacteroides intestinalis]|uniref:TonB-dependent receptor plug domain-containing protein n=1 Tax=Bacteroides intestinalis TaxID=329854 RepID=UPI001EDB1283|nr:TonB-dependent receptor plug domain-containing protein [Bacteroides intestinalis]MCG4740186.1 TonB-dependent receptor plug domain-containing protein [Bacteroides intestinalis]
MKKRYYIAAMFALGLVAQPATLRASAADEANGIEAVQQQKQRISGLLTDSNGDPIIGATVRVQGTTNRGVISDVEGRYSIEAAPGEVLEFSYIGFVSVDHRVNADETTFNLRMEMDAIATEEVVVVGYGKQKKESVVSSMSTVGPAQLSVKSANLTNNIAGKLSGLIAVQRSGEPGWDDAQFFIRGISSYAGGTDPLVLVDGVPRKMNDIDVDEIETFSILKDAAATAVYGAEGANGVVLITSKRGKSQKTVVSMSAEYGYSTPLRLPNLMSSYDYLSLYNEADWNSNGERR